MGDIFTGAPMYADDLARTILQTSRGRSFFFFALNCFGTRFGWSALDGWCKNIKDIILKDKLIFLHSIFRLPDHAAPKQVLLACLSSSSPRSWTNSMQHHLDALNLPDIPTLVANNPSAGIWLRCVDSMHVNHSKIYLKKLRARETLTP